MWLMVMSMLLLHNTVSLETEAVHPGGVTVT
jgi:hypothetical protein